MDFRKVEMKPIRAPITTRYPPRVPAIIPNINKIIAHINLEMNLEPMMQMAPITNSARAETVLLKKGRIEATRKMRKVTSNRSNSPNRI